MAAFDEFLIRIRENTLTGEDIKNGVLQVKDRFGKLTDEQVKALCEALSTNPWITGLNFNNSQLGPEGMAQLAAELPHLPRLEALYLHNNHIGNQGIQALVGILDNLPGLKVLSLSNNGIGNQAVQALVPVLQKHTELEILDFEGNDIKADGVQALVPALQKHTRLKTLYLGGNDIKADGVQALVGALGDYIRPENLFFQNNYIGLEGVQVLADFLGNFLGLKTLSLSGNNIGPEATQVLANALQNHFGLEALGLGGNNIEDQSVQLLAGVLKNNPGLAHLNLKNNTIGTMGVQALAEVLEDHPGLKTLDLTNNQIGEQGAQALAQALENNTTLTELHLNGNDDIAPKTLKKIEARLQRNRTLAKNQEPDVAERAKKTGQLKAKKTRLKKDLKKLEENSEEYQGKQEEIIEVQREIIDEQQKEEKRTDTQLKDLLKEQAKGKDKGEQELLQLIVATVPYMKPTPSQLPLAHSLPNKLSDEEYFHRLERDLMGLYITAKAFASGYARVKGPVSSRIERISKYAAALVPTFGSVIELGGLLVGDIGAKITEKQFQHFAALANTPDQMSTLIQGIYAHLQAANPEGLNKEQYRQYFKNIRTAIFNGKVKDFVGKEHQNTLICALANAAEGKPIDAERAMIDLNAFTIPQNKILLKDLISNLIETGGNIFKNAERIPEEHKKRIQDALITALHQKGERDPRFGEALFHYNNVGRVREALQNFVADVFGAGNPISSMSTEDVTRHTQKFSDSLAQQLQPEHMLEKKNTLKTKTSV